MGINLLEPNTHMYLNVDFNRTKLVNKSEFKFGTKYEIGEIPEVFTKTNAEEGQPPLTREITEMVSNC